MAGVQSSDSFASQTLDRTLLWVQFPMLDIDESQTNDTVLVLAAEGNERTAMIATPVALNVLVSAVDLLDKSLHVGISLNYKLINDPILILTENKHTCLGPDTRKI